MSHLGQSAAELSAFRAIIPLRREHLSVYVSGEPEALAFPGAMGGPLRRGNFNWMSAWPYAVRAIGAKGLHFHDLRHTGNSFAAASGAALRDLMARMGHDSERAALIYQHEAKGADQAITAAIDSQLRRSVLVTTMTARARLARWSPQGSGPLMARRLNYEAAAIGLDSGSSSLTCGRWWSG